MHSASATMCYYESSLFYFSCFFTELFQNTECIKDLETRVVLNIHKENLAVKNVFYMSYFEVALLYSVNCETSTYLCMLWGETFCPMKILSMLIILSA